MTVVALSLLDAGAAWAPADFGLEVHHGDPDVHVLMVRDGEEIGAGPTVGFAKVGPSTFAIELEWDEIIQVVEGAGTVVVDDGEPIDLGPGTAAHFTKGSRCRWTIREPLVELFVLTA